jgi:hypothetical protein
MQGEVNLLAEVNYTREALGVTTVYSVAIKPKLVRGQTGAINETNRSNLPIGRQEPAGRADSERFLAG